MNELTIRIMEREREVQRRIRQAEVAAALKDTAAAADTPERRRPRFSSLRAAARFMAFSAGRV